MEKQPGPPPPRGQETEDLGGGQGDPVKKKKPEKKDLEAHQR